MAPEQVLTRLVRLAEREREINIACDPNAGASLAGWPSGPVFDVTGGIVLVPAALTVPYRFPRVVDCGTVFSFAERTRTAAIRSWLTYITPYRMGVTERMRAPTYSFPHL